jgi:hypothetical protein
MNIDFDRFRGAAHHARTVAMHRYLFAPIAAFFRRLVKPEPRKPSAVFQSIRGC